MLESAERIQEGMRDPTPPAPLAGESRDAAGATWRRTSPAATMRAVRIRAARHGERSSSDRAEAPRVRIRPARRAGGNARVGLPRDTASPAGGGC
jgi:hypothetical protein